MKKMILFMAVVGLVLTAGIVSAGQFENCICWQLLPYTDTIKVCAPTGFPLVPNAYPAVVAGSWIQTVDKGKPGEHKTLVPMVGTIQKDLPGEGYRLMLEGTIKDLSLNSPFIFPCYIDANLQNNWDSLDLPVFPSTTPLKTSVLAYCQGYFPPDSPFGSTPDRLDRVDCYNNPKVLNPVNGGEIGEDF